MRAASRNSSAAGALEPEWSELEEKVFQACAEPQNFGKEFPAAFEAENVELWLDATVVRLEAEGTSARAALVRTRSGRELRVEARCFVLATGGIENARLLLLASRDGCPAGSRQRARPGRPLPDEPPEELPRHPGALARPVERAALLLRLSATRATPATRACVCAEDVQRERGLLNSYVRLEPLFPWSDNPGVESLVLFVKRSQILLQDAGRSATRTSW